MRQMDINGQKDTRREGDRYKKYEIEKEVGVTDIEKT